MTMWKYRNGYVEVYEDGIFVDKYLFMVYISIIKEMEERHESKYILFNWKR